MPRKTAVDRHSSTAPPAGWPPTGPRLFDVLVAFNHPTRRALYEVLSIEGPDSVGRLADRVGIAVGSASHHLRVLHSGGFIEPAPELAPSGRSSWWRSVPRSMEWAVEDAPPGTAGRAVLEAAEREQLAHELRAVVAWMRTRGQLAQEWQDASSTSSYTLATAEQMRDLGTRLSRVVIEWSEECAADRSERPEAERRPVRISTRVFPSDPGPQK